MKELWDKRYSSENYAYGTEPNVFFSEQLSNFNPGKILLPGEGEGRNAVYAAKLGWDVFAFDISIEGKVKAEKLAKNNMVDIEYYVGKITDLNLEKESFDIAALISAHLPPNLRIQFHYEVGKLVKPGGLVILEGFSKNNLPLRKKNPKIGGPDKIEMLFSKADIQEDFYNFEPLVFEEKEINLHEGIYHNGTARLIRFVGKKRV